MWYTAWISAALICVPETIAVITDPTTMMNFSRPPMSPIYTIKLSCWSWCRLPKSFAMNCTLMYSSS